ncbi:thioredoxin-dependent thiol peroxidase [Thalassolituus sp. LLYu03]|uniref:thioredoxin-dependent thiol peroxidase n=1 Tax=Thalassolituus sp. LLYu03 TaxID=3421656 RepID=UPI003D2878D5
MSLNFPALDAPAPAFSALNQKSETVTLDSLKGKKVLLYFYPKAMTPGCTTQACGVRDNADEFARLNTVVLGISPDAPARLQKFIDRDGLNFDLLSDEDHSIADAYGVWAMKKFMGKEFMGIHRISFFIDEQGVLRHIMKKVATKSHHDDALAVLRSL